MITQHWAATATGTQSLATGGGGTGVTRQDSAGATQLSDGRGHLYDSEKGNSQFSNAGRLVVRPTLLIAWANHNYKYGLQSERKHRQLHQH
jgi:hypothetical protein